VTYDQLKPLPQDALTTRYHVPTEEADYERRAVPYWKNA